MARNAGAQGRVDPQAARKAFNVRYVGEIASELRRVTWPTRQETMRLSVMVISVAAAIGLFLGIVDLAFARILDVLLGK
jgi:preprotein translocase subunit SecE